MGRYQMLWRGPIWEERKKEPSVFRNRQRGVTVFNVLTAIVIIAILAMIAIPTFTALMPKYRLNGAARQIMSELMSARMKAITLNRKVQVFFLDTHTYRICDDFNGDGVVGNPEGDAQTKDIQGNYYGITFTASGDPIFESRGTAVNDGGITVTNSSGSKNILINTGGGVRIQ